MDKENEAKLKTFPIGVSVENRQKHRKILNTIAKKTLYVRKDERGG